MSALRVSSLLVVVVVLLVTISTAQLDVEEWEKLVSAVFTGVNLLDNTGRLLVEGTIAGILASNHRNFGKYIRQEYPTNHYYPNLAASYGETYEDGASIKSVFFSSKEAHAERKVIQNTHNQLHSITTNYSPCHKCVERILDNFGNLPIDSRPVIQFSWVYDYPRKEIHLKGICRLVQRGFKIKSWETVKILLYLLEQAPSQILQQDLRRSIAKSAYALVERDMTTQELITSCSDSDSEEDSDDEEPSFYHGWSNSRRHDDDDDDEPGATGGATGRRGGGRGACSTSSQSSGSSRDGNRRASSWRQGATAQHSSGWSLNWFDSTAVTVLALWLMFLAWSIIRKLYRLCKGEGIQDPYLKRIGRNKRKPQPRPTPPSTAVNNDELQKVEKLSRKRKRSRRRHSSESLSDDRKFEALIKARHQKRRGKRGKSAPVAIDTWMEKSAV